EQRPVAFHGAARAVALTEPFPNFVLATRARRPGRNCLLKFGRSAPMRNGVTSSARPRLVGLLIAVVAEVIGVGGCSVLGLGGSTGGGSSSSSGNGKKLQLPENTNYQAGQAGPSPSPGAGVGGSPIRTPLAALPSVPVYTMTPSFNPSPVGPVCEGRLREGAVNGLEVTPLGGGRAEVRWMELGDPALQGYQLAAVSQKLVLGIQPPWK